MNKKQYNNVIEHTLKQEQSAKTGDSLATARAIFNNMGVALPQGDIKTVYETIKTDNYMGWRSCTMQEAKTAADNGKAAIGISEDRILVLSANDEEQPVTQTASVMTIDENTWTNIPSNMLFYNHTVMRTYGDEYSSRSFGSLNAAKDYFGWDHTYKYCGGYYNYYYTLENGAVKVYFHVG